MAAKRAPASLPSPLSAPPQQGYPARRRRTITYALMAIFIADLFSVLVAGLLAYHLRFDPTPAHRGSVLGLPPVPVSPQLYTKVIIVQAGMTVVLLWCFQAYLWRTVVTGLRQYTACLNAVALATLSTVFVGYLLYSAESISRGFLLLACVTSSVALCMTRFLVRRVLHALQCRHIFVARAVIVGTATGAGLLEWTLRRRPEFGYNVIGFVDASPVGTPVQAGLTVLGSIDVLARIVETHGVGCVLVARSALSHEDTLAALQAAAATEAEVIMASDHLQVLATGARVVDLPGASLLVIEKMRLTGGNRGLKMALDLTLASALLLMLSPVLIALAVLVRWRMGAGVLDRVPAVGAKGKVFYALKFRTTLTGEAAARRDTRVKERLTRGLPVRLYPDVTPLGRILRRYSLDELPQLLNVLRGDMSMVGPYKINPDQAMLYGRRQAMVTAMKPGITGICQVTGRGELTPEERALLDADYVRNYSIWQDLVILARTLNAVARGRGAY